MDEDDDDYFDPRLRWALENGESKSLILMQKQQFETEVRMMKMIHETPRLTKDQLLCRLNIGSTLFSTCVKAMRSRGIKLISEREKHDKPLRYWIEGPLRKVTFSLPG